MKTNPWIKLCKGATLALVLSYGLTFCYTSNGKSDIVDANKFRPVYHQLLPEGWLDDNRQFVFWYEPQSKWVKIESSGKEILFYQSEDKKEWNGTSSFGDGYGIEPYKFANPVMVQLPVDEEMSTDDVNLKGENLKQKKWVLIVNVNPGGYFGGSGTQYFIGDFDGTKFVCDNRPGDTKWLDWGKDYYASIRIPESGERTIAEACMNNWQYSNSMLAGQCDKVNALPRELRLYTHDEDIFLAATPVGETKNVRYENRQIPTFTVDKDYHIETILTDNEGAYELSMDIMTGKAEIMGFSLFNDKGEKVDIYFNLPEKKLVMDRTKSGKVHFGKNAIPNRTRRYDHRKTASINYVNDFALATWAPISRGDIYKLNVFVDKCSVEIFLNRGKITMTNLVFPSEPYNRMYFYSKGGTFEVGSFNVYKLGL